MIPEIELSRLQHEVGEWSRRNFPNNQPHVPLLGTVEEVSEFEEVSGSSAHTSELVRALGRLAHAHIKSEQGIRGTAEAHRMAKEDAIADIVIYLADYCERNGLNFARCVAETWAKVSKRDWTKNKHNGEVAAE